MDRLAIRRSRRAETDEGSVLAVVPRTCRRRQARHMGKLRRSDVRYNAGGVDGIGFVLTEADPFVFVDLDDTHGDDEALQRQFRIFHDFTTYAERSPSGNGLHIIGKAKLPGKGRKRAYVEIYDRSRYMTMTGDVYRVEPIGDVQDQAALLWHQMGGPAAIHHYEGDQPQREDDNTIIERARKALNGEKFTMLYEGDWRTEYHDDWSAADQALVDIVAFYTQNRAQIDRIWGYSQLGKREKFTKRHDYRTFTINRAFDKLLPQVDTEGLRVQFEAMLEGKAHVEEPTIPGLIVIAGNENGGGGRTARRVTVVECPRSSRRADAPPGRDASTARTSLTRYCVRQWSIDRNSTRFSRCGRRIHIRSRAASGSRDCVSRRDRFRRRYCGQGVQRIRHRIEPLYVMSRANWHRQRSDQRGHIEAYFGGASDDADNSRLHWTG
jgi:primase-polymerase (primpol)-like protein